MFISTIEDLNSGFAIDYRAAADSRVPLKAAFICVDFPNRKAADSEHPEPGFYYDILAGDGLRIFDKISYGRLNLSVELIDRWFTMPKNDAEYNMDRVITYETHRNYIEDALKISSSTVDYGKYDIVYIAPVYGSAVPYSPTMVAKENPIPCGDGKNGMGLAVTFGADMYTRKGKLFAHENGHILGLPDLYIYDIKEWQECLAHCGSFDLMGLIEAQAPDYLGYSKWRLGWIDASQVVCVKTADESGEFTLTPIEEAGGVNDSKLVVIPLDENNGYVIEYRAPVGLDAAMGVDGLLLYRVNGTVGNGCGCITVIPPEEEKYLKLGMEAADALIRNGMSVEREGIVIQSLGGGRVRVTRK